MGRKLARLVVVVVAALGVAGCAHSGVTGGSIPVGTASPTIAAPAQAPGPTSSLATLVPQERISLSAGPTALLPGVINLDTGVPVQLAISNSGGPCLFYVGEFLQGLLVPQSQTDVVTFTPTPAAPGSGAEPTVSMGCQGEAQRQGQVTLTATNPSTQSGAGPVASATPSPNERSLSITVTPTSVTPNPVAAVYDTPLDVVISNQSAPCLFHLGSALHGLLIPNNGIAEVLLTIPSNPPAVPTQTATVSSSATAVAPPVSANTAGCVSDSARTASLTFGGTSTAGTPATGGLATPAPVGTRSATPTGGGASATP